MSAHYVCKGENCSTIKSESGVCESDFCNAQGEDLMICGCEDDKHEAKAKESETSDEDSPETVSDEEME